MSILANRMVKQSRPKPARSVNLLVTPTGTERGVVRLTVGSKHTDYFVSEFKAGYGRGFAVEKIGADLPEEAVYHVNLDGERRSCDCMGHTHHGHCKHADGLATLAANGKL